MGMRRPQRPHTHTFLYNSVNILTLTIHDILYLTLCMSLIHICMYYHLFIRVIYCLFITYLLIHSFASVYRYDIMNTLYYIDRHIYTYLYYEIH
jgi:hypothetical protein